MDDTRLIRVVSDLRDAETAVAQCRSVLAELQVEGIPDVHDAIDAAQATVLLKMAAHGLVQARAEVAALADMGCYQRVGNRVCRSGLGHDGPHQ